MKSDYCVSAAKAAWTDSPAQADAGWFFDDQRGVLGGNVYWSVALVDVDSACDFGGEARDAGDICRRCRRRHRRGRCEPRCLALKFWIARQMSFSNDNANAN